ncbi:MAG: hypothetical protein K1060chlam4_01188 [Candidatus Anoxychlamydiales bacterium]|nr:hypothetical protein [Candidatus Anoxychlamydiales bacterium]
MGEKITEKVVIASLAISGKSSLYSLAFDIEEDHGNREKGYIFKYVKK